MVILGAATLTGAAENADSFHAAILNLAHANEGSPRPLATRGSEPDNCAHIALTSVTWFASRIDTNL
jgi:hypothetical protein